MTNLGHCWPAQGTRTEGSHPPRTRELPREREGRQACDESRKISNASTVVDHTIINSTQGAASPTVSDPDSSFPSYWVSSEKERALKWRCIYQIGAEAFAPFLYHGVHLRGVSSPQGITSDGIIHHYLHLKRDFSVLSSR